MSLIEQANEVYLKNFKPETGFERAIFFSWYCKTRDCTFCYMSTINHKRLIVEHAQKHAVSDMSTQPKNKTKLARRTAASILAEVILCKKLSWDIGFISGGHDAYTTVEFKELLQKISIVSGQKQWINVGALSKEGLKQFQPYIKGVVGSIETVNKKVHDNVCPSKPAEPYYEMFEYAKELGLKNAITIILGLGETIDDFDELRDIIERYNIEKIHFYSLNPQKGTVFEHAQSPTKEYQAEWIARTRIEFPKINIQAGIWLDKVDNVSLLLMAGANSISKFPAIKYFNSKHARAIELNAKEAGRAFKGTLTEFKRFDIDKELDKYELDLRLKEEIKDKLGKYIKALTKNEAG